MRDFRTDIVEEMRGRGRGVWRRAPVRKCTRRTYLCCQNSLYLYLPHAPLLPDRLIRHKRYYSSRLLTLLCVCVLVRVFFSIEECWRVLLTSLCIGERSWAFQSVVDVSFELVSVLEKLRSVPGSCCWVFLGVTECSWMLLSVVVSS